MKVYIKNMVCQGTRKFVLMELKKLGLKLISFDSGEIEFENELLPSEASALEISLKKYGLEIISETDIPGTSLGYTFNKPEIQALVDEYFVDKNEVTDIKDYAELNPVN